MADGREEAREDGKRREEPYFDNFDPLGLLEALEPLEAPEGLGEPAELAESADFEGFDEADGDPAKEASDESAGAERLEAGEPLKSELFPGLIRLRGDWDPLVGPLITF